MQDINSRSTTLLGAERPSAEEAVYMFNLICLKMKKLKRLVLNSGRVLSSEEMTSLCGGEFLTLICHTEGERCAIIVQGGVNTGYCQWIYTSSTTKELMCVPD